jgi:hypothetical protein
MPAKIGDSLTIKRVANGWVISPGPGTVEFTHVAKTPAELATHVTHWAKAQSDEFDKGADRGGP